MSLQGYGITFYDPTQVKETGYFIPDSLSLEYLVEQFRVKWGVTSINDVPDYDYLTWLIPELDSGDEDNMFAGILSKRDLGFAFNLAPHETVVELVYWVRSIVGKNVCVYFVEIYELKVTEIPYEITQKEILSLIFPYSGDV